MKGLLLIVAFLSSYSLFSQNGKTDISGEEYFITDPWKIRKIGDEKWIENVNFPNSIHQILYHKNIIDNPYEGDNEKDLKWIEESDWEAEVEFEIYGSSKYAKHEIIFESLEPYIRVYINDQFLFESGNAFLQYKFDITGLLNKGTDLNKLRLQMDSPIKRGKELQQKNRIILPGDERIYTRKPQYEYGWDWGPRFVKSGIKSWVSVVSHFKNYNEIRDHHISMVSLTEKEAKLLVEFEVYADNSYKQNLTISLGNKTFYKKAHKLNKGINHFSIPISIKNPEIWWPNGMGKQPIYSFSIDVRDLKSMLSISSSLIRYAICDIKLIREKDSIGESFYFSVNGKPTYLKGFNLIPESHISEFDNINDNYSNLITQMKEMNCNAVRIWGGGEYLPYQVMEEFQEYGIIVWQDFMFAGGMYPGDSSFLNNVEEEITYQVKRLRNYNNIALYCGNNEIDEAWHNWGWQKQYNYSKKDSTKIWNDYLKLFHELIPSIVKKYDPETDYIPSSPEIGWGRKESMTQGDSHYWGVWWGKEPFETFEEKIPRFMSEFGMQAMPNLATLRKVIPDSLMNFDSPEFKNHQKHPTGFETLNYYLEKYLTVPKDLNDYAYATQLLQTLTLQKAIEAERMSEKCMGTLIWQLNDTWPVTSWSLLDSEGKKKLAYHYVQKSFADAFFHLEKDSSEYHLYLLNDSQNQAGKRDIRLTFNDFLGNNILDTIITSKIEKGKNEIISFTAEEFKKYSLDKIYLTVNCDYPHAFSILYFEELNQLKILKPNDKSYCKIEDYLFTKHGKIFSKHYEVTLIFDQDLHFPHFIDTEFLENNFPEILKKGKGITVNLPFTNFINEQAAIDYVKNNLKSINHLLGK